MTLETLDGVSSGFVGAEYVKRTGDEPRGFIEGIVRKIEDDTITVQLPGSYFTTAMGMTRFSTAWAKDNGAVPASAQPGRLVILSQHFGRVHAAQGSLATTTRHVSACGLVGAGCCFLLDYWFRGLVFEAAAHKVRGDRNVEALVSVTGLSDEAVRGMLLAGFSPAAILSMYGDAKTKKGVGHA